MEMQGIVFDIIIFGVAALALIITVGHKTMTDRMLRHMQDTMLDNSGGRIKHLELMKQLSDIVDRTVKDIHQLYEALKVTAGTLEEHNERIQQIEDQMLSITGVVNQMHREQENMKITHL